MDTISLERYLQLYTLFAFYTKPHTLFFWLQRIISNASLNTPPQQNGMLRSRVHWGEFHNLITYG